MTSPSEYLPGTLDCLEAEAQTYRIKAGAALRNAHYWQARGEKKAARVSYQGEADMLELAKAIEERLAKLRGK